ncbi:hypothetical protein [Constantimarinum furrinae]|uniref:YD repeat-containing protein n=1 Tax=Constantimarinum furrinae TaxID=2562285 RepID=A0A7G8PVJ0_9FLAO|nr:hypothetical protein [Constantimarinum furrinae]QNJ98356.1 hypothetical protein ALE3EI_1807 [Constantimarinum furrinae]
MTRFIFLISCLFILLSCNSSDDEAPTSNPAVLIGTNLMINGVSGTTALTYDNNILTGFTEVFNASGSMSDREIQLEATNGVITRYTESYIDQGSGFTCYIILNFSYDDLNRIDAITGEGDCPLNIYTIEYINDTVVFDSPLPNEDKVVKMNQDGRIVYYEYKNLILDMEYENGNLISKTRNSSRTINYSYDSKVNPYRTDAFLNFGKIQEYIKIMKGTNVLMEDLDDYRNVNNLVSRTSTHSDLGIDDLSYSYEYHSNNLPDKRFRSVGNGVTQYLYE